MGRPEEKVRAVGDRVLSVLGRQGWLDRPGYRFEHALGFALAACGGAGERTSNLLHGTWLGHPTAPTRGGAADGCGGHDGGPGRRRGASRGTSRGCGRRPGSASVSGSSPAWLRQRRA